MRTGSGSVGREEACGGSSGAGRGREGTAARGARRRQRRRDAWWEDWGPEWGGSFKGGGRRMRRGDIRTALLAVLTEGPGHGYEIIDRLEEKSGGMWRPSPGSVYPTLQMFEDEGLVVSEKREGKRVYELTDTGRTEAAARAERFGKTPWESEGGQGAGRHEAFRGLRKAGEHLGPGIPPFLAALRQVGMSGDPAQIERASEVVKKATKELYQILAAD